MIKRARSSLDFTYFNVWTVSIDTMARPCRPAAHGTEERACFAQAARHNGPATAIITRLRNVVLKGPAVSSEADDDIFPRRTSERRRQCHVARASIGLGRKCRLPSSRGWRVLLFPPSAVVSALSVNKMVIMVAERTHGRAIIKKKKKPNEKTARSFSTRRSRNTGRSKFLTSHERQRPSIFFALVCVRPRPSVFLFLSIFVPHDNVAAVGFRSRVGHTVFRGRPTTLNMAAARRVHNRHRRRCESRHVWR